MTDPRIEAAARAAALAVGMNPDNISDSDKPMWQHYIRPISAAIVAFLRQPPTEGMLDRGAAIRLGKPDVTTDEVWSAMAQQAIKELTSADTPLASPAPPNNLPASAQ